MMKIVRDFEVNESGSGDLDIENEEEEGVDDYGNGDDEYEADDQLPIEDI
jgi:hypothetical protein